MTVRQALRLAETYLTESGIGTAELDALVLLENSTGQDRSHLLAHPEDEFDSSKYLKLVHKRSQRIPLSQLTGQKEFYGLELTVNSQVLSPRPESEQLVDLAIKYAPKNSRLLDIGTGCGALAIAISKNRPDLEITASDISTAALVIARQNAARHRVKVEFRQSDLWQGLSLQGTVPTRDSPYSTIVANLPYLPNDAELNPEARTEPAEALFGGGDGLDLYRRMSKDLSEHLAAGGYLIVESDPWQQPELIKIAAAAGLQAVEQTYFSSAFRARIAIIEGLESWR